MSGERALGQRAGRIGLRGCGHQLARGAAPARRRATARARRRSPSVTMPDQLAVAVDDAGHAEPLGRHLAQRVDHRAPRPSRSGISSPVCISSSTRSSRRPRAPPGWRAAKSSARKPRRSSSATASASPSASAAVVLAVGARPSGHASSRNAHVEHHVRRTRRASTPGRRSSRPRACRAAARRARGSDLVGRRRCSKRRAARRRASSMPRSPCRPSAACRKNAGVPVRRASRRSCGRSRPDLPMPRHDDLALAAPRARRPQRERPRRALAASASSARTSMSQASAVPTRRRASTCGVAPGLARWRGLMRAPPGSRAARSIAQGREQRRQLVERIRVRAVGQRARRDPRAPR